MGDQVSTDEATAARYENYLIFHLNLFLLSFDWPCQSELSYLSVNHNENETADSLGVWLIASDRSLLRVRSNREDGSIRRRGTTLWGAVKTGNGPRRRSRMYLFGGTIQPRS